MPEGVAQQITVGVRLFASYRESAGTARLQASVASGARVQDLQAQLEARVPALGRARGLVAVNQTYVGPDFVLHEGDEVAFIPPVSGGASQEDPTPQPPPRLRGGGEKSLEGFPLYDSSSGGSSGPQEASGQGKASGAQEGSRPPSATGGGSRGAQRPLEEGPAALERTGGPCSK